MEEKELEELKRQYGEILRRLSAINLGELTIDRTVVAKVFKEHFEALSLPIPPIRWARDGQHAHALAANSVIRNLDYFNRSVLTGRDRLSWTEGRDFARDTAHAGVLDAVLRLLYGRPVLLSIPWRLYRGRMTGERGSQASGDLSHAWETANDALALASRAAGECTWVQNYYESGGAFEQWNFDYGIESFEKSWFPFVDAYEAGLWLFWVTEKEIIALSRPILKFQGDQLHSETGPAVRWPEGEEEYFILNGVHVPPEIVETPSSQLDPRLILRERNAEVRREIVRKLGIERVCLELNAQCIDRQGDYELLLLDLQDGRHRPFLKMKNPSIGVYHIEGVAPGCETVAQALSWRNQSEEPPSVLT